MNIAVIGLGYVGCVTSACFAHRGHRVYGVDISEIKVDQVNSATPPVREEGLAELLSDVVSSGRLSASTSLSEVWDDVELAIVSVGTPSGIGGDTDLTALSTVVEELGDLLARAESFKVVVITSTIPPGTLRNYVRPTLEKFSGKKAGVGFGLCFSPEFLRESSAVKDFLYPEKIVIGSDDDASTEALRTLFQDFESNPTITTPETAETVKFAANAWHALKVTFANEIGRIAKDAEISSQEVMQIFKEDRKLNISDKYLSPGFAFGGSCLPKDIRTLTYRARLRGVRVPVLESIIPSNDEHQAYALRHVESLSPKSVLLLGLAFKAGTDDLRESPSVPLAEALLGRGYRLEVFDEEIQVSKLVGANQAYVEARLPHIKDLLVSDLASVTGHDLVIVAQPNRRFLPFLNSLPSTTTVLDLAGFASGQVDMRARYLGLTW